MASLVELSRALPAPERFRRRPDRYRGAEEGISLAALTATDGATARRAYDFLGELMASVRPAILAGRDGEAEARAFLASHSWDALMEDMRALGAGISQKDAPLAVRMALHDVRGGSFQGLLIHLDLMAEGLSRPGDASRLFILARDHRKMMRNALVDLDERGYAADLEPMPHRVDLLQAKWSGVTYPVGEREVRVELDSHYDGAVSERCMEFAALDRVLYNLINNAARFAADGTVRLGLVPHEVHGETHLRFVVANRITAAQEETLRAAFGNELGRVYEGGFTTGGHGVGLRIVGDVVSHGYALAGVRPAVAEGYLGAVVEDGQYLAWFFWPAASEEPA